MIGTTENSSDDKVIDAILAIERLMFTSVKSALPTVCQKNPEKFTRIRRLIFCCWPGRLLRAYLNDLRNAHRLGRNLLTEKYARMDNLLLPITPNGTIERIVEIESSWQSQMENAYPALFRRMCRANGQTGDGSCFSTYLRSELETYGDATLAAYLAWVEQGAQQGRNYSIAMLEQLVQQGGFDSLDQAERCFAKQILL